MKAKVKQPKLTYIYADAEEKYVKNVVLYSNADGEVFYDEQLTQQVNGKDLQNFYLKGLVVFNTESQQYLTPTQFTVNGEEGTIDFGGSGSGSGEKKTLVMWLNYSSYPGCEGYLEAEIDERNAYLVTQMIGGYNPDNGSINGIDNAGNISEESADELISILKTAIPHFVAYHTFGHNTGVKELAERFAANISDSNNKCIFKPNADIFYDGSGFSGMEPSKSEIAFALTRVLATYISRAHQITPMNYVFDEGSEDLGVFTIIGYANNPSDSNSFFGSVEYKYSKDNTVEMQLIYEH